MFSEEGYEVIGARYNPEAKAQFIADNEKYILSCASRFTKRFITKSDDEWSIALLAFNVAIDTYEQSKGSFLSYARLLIERRLTDYVRTHVRFNNEISTEPYVFEGRVDEDSDNAAFQASIIKNTAISDENPLRDEIVALTADLARYKITFMELADVSPKAAKTKASCKEIIKFIASTPELVEIVKEQGKIPGKVITEKLKVPQKILERHRKYIIAAVIIVTEDYPLMAEYLK